MSNRAILTAMKFEALSGDITYGYHLSDDYALDFDDNAESMIEDDLDCLRFAVANAGDAGREILNSIQENEKGIIINSNHYDWDEIKAIMQGEEG